MNVLSRLHDINPKDIGLGDFGNTSKNYWDRVISTWGKQYNALKHKVT